MLEGAGWDTSTQPLMRPTTRATSRMAIASRCGSTGGSPPAWHRRGPGCWSMAQAPATFRAVLRGLSARARSTSRRTRAPRTAAVRPRPRSSMTLDGFPTAPSISSAPCTCSSTCRIRRETLRDFARWLRPGGRLLYVVPDPDGAGHRIKKDALVRLPRRQPLLTPSSRRVGRRHPGRRLRDRATGRRRPLGPALRRRVPRVLQLATFGLPAAAQVGLGRAFLPAGLG